MILLGQSDLAPSFLYFVSIQDYKDTCFAHYKSLVMADSDDKRIISANWAKDEDINRFDLLIYLHDCNISHC